MSEKEILIKDIAKIRDELIDYVNNSKIVDKQKLIDQIKIKFTEIENSIRGARVEKSDLTNMNSDEIQSFVKFYQDKVCRGENEIKGEINKVENNYEKAIEYFKSKNNKFKE